MRGGHRKEGKGGVPIGVVVSRTGSIIVRDYTYMPESGALEKKENKKSGHQISLIWKNLWYGGGLRRKRS